MTRFYMRFTMISLFIGLLSLTTYSQSDEVDVKGRWDIVMEMDGKEVPSWLEIKKSGYKTLIGRFVFAFGSARPVAEIKRTDNKYHFLIPVQWEPGEADMQFEFVQDGDGLKGTMIYTDGKTHHWTAVRQPTSTYNATPQWGAPIEVFNGTNLSGWHTDGVSQWLVKDGILTSEKSGVNLITDQQFSDFKLHAEFRYPKGGNSGIYLRGRYEVQIEDGHGHEPSDILFGGVYGFLTPNQMAAHPAGEWQTYDITLIGNRVSIIANGVAIITDQIIPGITGGAIDSHEGEPGSFFLQGDHGPVEFRKFVVTPVVN